MIVCVCNNISDKECIKCIKYICGKCKQLTQFDNILTSYNTYTLHFIDDMYYVYNGYTKIAEFVRYKDALHFFEDLKHEKI